MSACLSQVDVGFYLGLNRSYAKEVTIGEISKFLRFVVRGVAYIA